MKTRHPGQMAKRVQLDQKSLNSKIGNEVEQRIRDRGDTLRDRAVCVYTLAAAVHVCVCVCCGSQVSRPVASCSLSSLQEARSLARMSDTRFKDTYRHGYNILTNQRFDGVGALPVRSHSATTKQVCWVSSLRRRRRRRRQARPAAVHRVAAHTLAPHRCCVRSRRQRGQRWWMRPTTGGGHKCHSTAPHARPVRHRKAAATTKPTTLLLQPHCHAVPAAMAFAASLYVWVFGCLWRVARGGVHLI